MKGKEQESAVLGKQNEQFLVNSSSLTYHPSLSPLLVKLEMRIRHLSPETSNLLLDFSGFPRPSSRFMEKSLSVAFGAS